MATSDVDQKTLGRLALQTGNVNPLLSSSLYQLLGLSITLSRKLYRARKLRKLDTSRDTKSLSLYHHIIWLSREGLTILEIGVIPYTQENQYGTDCLVLVAKLRASFFHIFCLFHNSPPVSQFTISNISTQRVSSPLSPRQGNSQNRKRTSSGVVAQSSTLKSGTKLRDPIPSITSDASYVTNPYALSGNGTTGTSPLSTYPTLGALRTVPHPSDFLLPSLNFVPRTAAYFSIASDFAAKLLPGSHPLRLSVALEHAAFLWDCAHEHEAARNLARRAIRDVYRAQEGMDDAEFEDAAELVAILGQMMRRASYDGTMQERVKNSTDRENNMNGDFSSASTPLDGSMDNGKSSRVYMAQYQREHPKVGYNTPLKKSSEKGFDSLNATNNTPKGQKNVGAVEKGSLSNGHNRHIPTTSHASNEKRPPNSSKAVARLLSESPTSNSIPNDDMFNPSIAETPSSRLLRDSRYHLFPGKQRERIKDRMHDKVGYSDLHVQSSKLGPRDGSAGPDRSDSITPRAGGPVRTPDSDYRM